MNKFLQGKPTMFKPIDGLQPEVNDELNNKISLYQGDITKLAIDVIVNAANNTLRGGGGGKNIKLTILSLLIKYLSHILINYS